MEPNFDLDIKQLSQSWLHMILCYYKSRIEAAVAYLRRLPAGAWPVKWLDNLGADVVRFMKDIGQYHVF